MQYGHASMLLLGKGSEATEPYNKYNKIRPHSIRSLQFDQKVRPLSFRPEKFDLFTATLCAKQQTTLDTAHFLLTDRYLSRCYIYPMLNHFYHQLQLYIHKPSLIITNQCQFSSSFGNWSLGLMPFGLKSFGLIQLVTWLNFFRLNVSGIGQLA